MQIKSGLKPMTMNKGSDKIFTELHEAYIKKCKVNNLSEYTINFYKVSVRMFGKFVDIDQLKANEINRELIDDYILHLKETGVKDVTINTYIHGISPAIKYGMELGIIRKFGFKEIKTREEIKETYTKQESYLKNPLWIHFLCTGIGLLSIFYWVLVLEH